jgi:hypothetical protein
VAHGISAAVNSASRAGQTYEATVNYDAGLYDVEIREIGPNGRLGRKIEQRSLSDCHRA